MRGLSLCFVYYVVLLTGTAVSSPSIKKTPKLSKHPKILVVSFDGFRYDYMRKTSTPHLESILSEGVTVPWMQAQFPTKTFPNHQSMATGLYPDVHGITDNVVFDPKHEKTLIGFIDDPEFWNFSPDVLPIYIRNEQAGNGRYSGCFMWAGSSTPYGKNNDILPTHWRKYDKSVPWSDRVDTVISWLTNEDKPVNLAFLYYDEPDSRGHLSGAEDEETLKVVRQSDDRVGQLVKRLKNAGIYDSVNLIIVSDHGMQTVSRETIIDTRTMADPESFKNSGKSPLKQLWPLHTTLEDLHKNFTAGVNAANGTFRVYRKEEMGFLNYSTNRRIAPLLLLAQPGYAFEDVKSFNGQGKAGIHGYDPRTPSMYAFFAARGPNFKRNFVSPTPISNLDLVPLLSEILGIPTPPNNGSLANTKNLLVTVTTDLKNEGGDHPAGASSATRNILNSASLVVLLFRLFDW